MADYQMLWPSFFIFGLQKLICRQFHMKRALKPKTIFFKQLCLYIKKYLALQIFEMVLILDF